MATYTWPEDWPGDRGNRILVREYGGSNIEADFQGDAEALLAEGYEPSGQHYVEGGYGCLACLVGVVLVPLGVLMLMGRRPPGTLVVTFVRRDP